MLTVVLRRTQHLLSASFVTTELIGGIPIVAPQAAVGGKPQVQITLQAGGSNTDGNFSVAVFGE